MHNLSLSDVDFERKRVFVRAGKNGKDRYTLLANEAAALLRAYFQVYHPVSYVFFGADPSRRISIDAIQRNFHRVADATLGNRAAHVHTLRHCFATHLLENGTSVFYVMRLLGHSSILTTMRYLHMQDLDALGLVSPIDAPPPPPVPSSSYPSYSANAALSNLGPLASADRPSPTSRGYPVGFQRPSGQREPKGSFSTLDMSPAEAWSQGDLFSGS